MSEPITVAVFDLDDTLYDCYGQRVLAAHRHACQKMVEAGLQADLETLYRRRLELFRKTHDLESLDRTLAAEFHSTDPHVIEAGRDGYYGFPVGKLDLFPDARPLLETLHNAGVSLFLLTLGDPEIQKQKIHALGLEGSPLITGVVLSSLGRKLTKEDALRKILAAHEPNPARVLVVGDRPDGEIRAARGLGLRTVRLRHGEFADYNPTDPLEQADFTISSLGELLNLGLRFGC